MVGTRPETDQDEPRHRGARPAGRARAGAFGAKLRLRAQPAFSSSELGIRKPDHFLEASGETPAADDRRRSSPRPTQVFAAEKPDALLLYGDTNTCLAVIARQAPEDSRVPHGGRQPLLRPAGAGGTQPQGARPPERHQPGADRARPQATCWPKAFARAIIKTGSTWKRC